MADVVIIGAGLAGLATAIKLKRENSQLDIVVLGGKNTNTSMAKSGASDPRATARDGSDADAIAQAIEEYIENLNNKAGYDQDNPNPFEVAIKQYSGDIRPFLESCGFQPDAEYNGAPGHMAGGKPVKRLLATGVKTGGKLMDALSKTAKDLRISVINESAYTVSKDDGRINGVYTVGSKDSVEFYPTHHVVIATGGVAGMWPETTNGTTCRGVGVGQIIAQEIGARLEGMYNVQFHPTAVAAGKDPCFLLGAAWRGTHGAKIVWRKADGTTSYTAENSDGSPMRDADGNPQELAKMTRGPLARFMHEQIQAGGSFYLDISPVINNPDIDEEKKAEIKKHCPKDGSENLIPIAPAAHYSFGGIAVGEGMQVLDDDGNVIPGVFAVGEAAYTGMHGENRLAGNSLAECVISARYAAAKILEELEKQKNAEMSAEEIERLKQAPPPVPPVLEKKQLQELREAIAKAITPSGVDLEGLHALGGLISEMSKAYQSDEVVSHTLETAKIIHEQQQQEVINAAARQQVSGKGMV
ncbi:MAG: FAD-dependent oxidoreductase [Holosporales bacterium]|jgi:L-aspartate oxidase